MKNLTKLGFVVFAISFMSFTVEKNAPAELKTYPLVTVNCANGYSSSYYDIGYSDEDIADIESAICSDS